MWQRNEFKWTFSRLEIDILTSNKASINLKWSTCVIMKVEYYNTNRRNEVFIHTESYNKNKSFVVYIINYLINVEAMEILL